MRIETLIEVAGAGQLLLATGSLAIPTILGWRDELRRLTPLTRQVFWTYSGYILATNVALGLVSLLDSAALLGGTSLAGYVTAFAALYWGVRLIIQFVAYDRTVVASVALRLAETMLVALFGFLTLVYSAAAGMNFASA